MDNTITVNINRLTQEERNQLISKSKKKRKFRAMTIGEHCDYTRPRCRDCEYFRSLYYCDYSKFHKVQNGREPYKTKDGKYILIEVKSC